jgi:N-acetylglucosamine-6-phosphate deacetylase
VIVAGQLALGRRVAAGWVEVADGVVLSSGHGVPPRQPDESVEGILAPGLCDLQVNGGAGVEVSDGEAALDAIDALQLAHGVTSYLPTLVSPDDATAEKVLPVLGDRARDPCSPVAGVHVEGPFLSPGHTGMHPPRRLRVPADGIPRWLDDPAIRLVTIAPELPGALELIARLTSRGVTVSLGHSGATLEQAQAGFDAGATMVTHIFNAMAPLHHRNPGLAGAALADERVHVCVIADGRHVHPVVLDLIRRAAGARVVLVSDATPAAGAAAGRFEMAGVTIERRGDGAALTPEGRLAGSTLTLDEAVPTWISATNSSVGEAWAAAADTASTAVGLEAVLSPGSAADLVELDTAARVRRVMLRGRWAHSPA